MAEMSPTAVASGSTAIVMTRSSSTGARQRRTPRIGMVDSPTQLSSASGSPAPTRAVTTAPAELPYIRSPFRPFGLFTALANVLAPVPEPEPPSGDVASPRTLYSALDEHTAAEPKPAIRIVPPRRATEVSASSMSRGTSSSSSSVYSSSSDLSMARLDSLTSFETTSSKEKASERSSSRGSSVTMSPHSSTHSSWLKLTGRIADGDRLASRSSTSSATLRHQKGPPSRQSSGWTSLPSPHLRNTPTWPLSPSPLRQEVRRAPRWTTYKWWLLISTLSVRCRPRDGSDATQVLSYGLAGFICTLLTWFRSAFAA